MNALEMLVSNAERLVSSGYYEVPSVQISRRRKPSMQRAIMESPSFPIIAEVKMASPGRLIISQHPPEDLIDLYRQGGATALSVLTEPNHFHGSLGLLSLASSIGLPSLMKDFIVSMDQIEAAANLGASAVLLIEKLNRLEPIRLDIDDLVEGAHSLGLEVLLEVSDEVEMRRGLNREADMIGINQRDLGSMRVDRTKGQKLLAEFAVMSHLPLIVMSGIDDVNQIVDLRDRGASGALIGTALSSSPDPVGAIRELTVRR
jgi:indole-3-glycerol phosphate synthase